MPTPVYTAAEARTRSTFLALMNALSYPGQPQDLPLEADANPFWLIADTLLDLETSYFTPDSALAGQLSRTVARAESIDRAEYIFYSVVSEDDLAALATASIGTMLFPDQAATLILGCSFEDGIDFCLTGPGIQGETSIQVGNLPLQFWTLRDMRRHYPLGWDIFLVSGAQVIGLPRSTQLSY